jgi:hypothetical protein
MLLEVKDAKSFLITWPESELDEWTSLPNADLLFFFSSLALS